MLPPCSEHKRAVKRGHADSRSGSYFPDGTFVPPGTLVSGVRRDLRYVIATTPVPRLMGGIAMATPSFSVSDLKALRAVNDALLDPLSYGTTEADAGRKLPLPGTLPSTHSVRSLHVSR